MVIQVIDRATGNECVAFAWFRVARPVSQGQLGGIPNVRVLRTDVGVPDHGSLCARCGKNLSYHGKVEVDKTTLGRIDGDGLIICPADWVIFDKSDRRIYSLPAKKFFRNFKF